MAWLREWFAGSRVALHHRLEHLADAIMALELSDDGTLSTVAIERWFKTLRSLEIDDLYAHVLHSSRTETRAATAWAANEKAFKHYDEDDPLGRAELVHAAGA